MLVARENPPVSTERPSLKKSISWMFIGRLVYNGGQWGMLCVISRMGSIDHLGQFVFALAVTAPIVMFANLQLRMLQATDIRDAYPFSDYFRLRMVSTYFAMAAIAGIGWLTSSDFSTFAAVAAMGLAKAIESISEVYYGVLQRHEQIGVIARSMMIKGPLSLVAVGVGFYATGTVYGACLALGAAWLLLLLLYDVPQSLRWAAGGGSVPSAVAKTPSRTRRLLQLAWDAAPLGLAAGLLSLEANLPRYVAKEMFGAAELGAFGATVYLMTISQTIVQSVSYSVIPRFARQYVEGRIQMLVSLLLKLLAGGVVVGLAMTAGAWLFGEQILKVCYGPDFGKYYVLFSLAAVAAGLKFLKILLFAVSRAMRLNRVLFLLQMASMVCTAVLSLSFARSMGIDGLGWALILTEVVNILLLAGVVWLRIASARRNDVGNAADAAEEPAVVPESTC